MDHPILKLGNLELLIAHLLPPGQECVLTFQQILRDEEAMASWLQEQLPMLVQERLQ